MTQRKNARHSNDSMTSGFVTTEPWQRLKITQIQPYANNPRRGDNPEYARIKASMRADGLNQPLVVTQRPGEPDYTLYAGGNTRLRALTELYSETGDERFLHVACAYRPWTGESDVLLAHLKENELRGELSFIDKAAAVFEANALLTREAGQAEFSQAHLAECLKARGYNVSQGLISQMFYAVERLLPMLPQALNNGMGRPQVEKIRALDRVAHALWCERSIDTEAEYDTVFEALCQRYDNPDWDIANLRRAIEAEIAERADLNIHAVSMELDALLGGRSILTQQHVQGASPRSDGDATDTATSAHAVQPPMRASDSPSTVPVAAAHSRRQRGADKKAETDADSAADAHAYADAGVKCADADAEADVTLASRTPPVRDDIKSLRAELWTLASRLAQRNGLGDLVQALADCGAGFVLRDVPDPALLERLDEDALAQVSMVWWHLAACAELTVAPLDALLPALPEQSVLRRALLAHDAGLLFSSVWTLDPGHTGHRLWRQLDDRDWHDALALMETYRALHRRAAAEGQPLWRVSA